MVEIVKGFTLLNLFTAIGGLSVFLYGLEMMSFNLGKISDNTMRLVLEKATSSPWIGILIGTLVTGISQSSTATTCILVSLVDSQLMSFERSLAVIMGANIGSTVTGQIVAFRVTEWSFAIITLGYLGKLIAQRTKTKSAWYILLGLGFLFFGLDVMSIAMKGLRNSEYFLTLMKNFENIPFGILVGTIFTAIIHSSGAFTGIVMGLAMQNLISIEASVPLILGSNIGTCFTACLAAINAKAAARRVAAAHVIFNISGVIAFAFIVPQFISLVELFTPKNDIPRFVANAQTIFNILSVVIWLPFIKQLSFLSEKSIPEDKIPQKAKYVFPRVSSLAKSPELLFMQSIDAIRHYKNIVKQMLWTSRDYFLMQEETKVVKLKSLREEQQEFRMNILDFLSRVGKLRLSYSEISTVLSQTTLVNEIEHIAYQLDTAIDTMQGKLPSFDDGYRGLEEYFRQSVKCFSKACNAVLNSSYHECKRITEHLDTLKFIEDELKNRSVEDLHHENNQEKYEQEKLNLWVLEFLRSVNATSKKICQIIIDQHIAAIKKEPAI